MEALRTEDLQAIDLEMRDLRACILPFGATLAGLWSRGHGSSLVLGFDDPAAYAREPHHYMGAVIGRTANRIAHGRARIEGEDLSLPINVPPHHSHGGTCGFSARVWEVEDRTATRLTLRLDSPDGDQGYPGAVTARVSYALIPPSTLRLEMEAQATRPTPLGLCHHPYFNLSDCADMSGHVLALAASRYLPCDETILPTGEIAPVEGTPFDFRQPRRLGEILSAGHRLNNTVVLHERPAGPIAFAARLTGPTGLALELRTTQPGLHVYTAHKLHSDEPERSGRAFTPLAALCLEAQAWPNSLNTPGFPHAVCKPGMPYRQVTEYAIRA